MKQSWNDKIALKKSKILPLYNRQRQSVPREDEKAWWEEENLVVLWHCLSLSSSLFLLPFLAGTSPTWQARDQTAVWCHVSHSWHHHWVVISPGPCFFLPGREWLPLELLTATHAPKFACDRTKRGSEWLLVGLQPQIWHLPYPNTSFLSKTLSIGKGDSWVGFFLELDDSHWETRNRRGKSPPFLSVSISILMLPLSLSAFP